MKYKGTIEYIIETHFVDQENNAYDLLSQLIYDDFKKELNHEKSNI